MDVSTARKALSGIATDGRRARLGDKLPESHRPSQGFMISIGLGPPEEPDELTGDDADLAAIEDDDTDE